jgi:phytoene synthase
MLSLDACYDRCRSIALSHYENFPVGSILLPRKLRPHVFALYAFMRTADDIADDPARQSADKLAELAEIRKALAQGSDDPIIRATRHTLETRELSSAPLERLLDAFEFDARGEVCFQTYADLRWYTARSAEPVGQLILALFGYSSPALVQLSNEITSALQLLNFLQDIREDLAAGRSYIPLEDMQRYGIEGPDKLLGHPRAPELLGFEADRVETMLHSGFELPELVTGRLRYELRAVIQGALAVLAKMRASGWRYVSDLSDKPKLHSADKIRILLLALAGAVK